MGLMRYGNPEKLNRYETAVKDTFRAVGRLLEKTLVEAGYEPSIHYDRLFYYDDQKQPSRFLETPLGPHSILRLALQRNIPSKTEGKIPNWTCYTTLFKSGHVVAEGERDCAGLSEIRDFINEVISRIDDLKLQLPEDSR